MRRYLLFVYDHYYPYGGWADFKGSYDSLEEITRVLTDEHGYPKAQAGYDILDTHTEIEDGEWQTVTIQGIPS